MTCRKNQSLTLSLLPCLPQPHLLALLCLGEIGRRTDLSSHTTIQSVLMASFHSPSDEIKAAAAYALGSVAFGNLATYLPFILSKIGAQPKLQYLLLHSLKEVITRQSLEAAQHAEFSPSDIAQILSLLFLHCESGEEGVRNVVAECLGKFSKHCVLFCRFIFLYNIFTSKYVAFLV